MVKNTLTKIAANNAGTSSFDDELKGPSAIAFVHGDPVAVAKSLRDFAKANLLVVKGGYFDGKPLTAEEVGSSPTSSPAKCSWRSSPVPSRPRCSEPHNVQRTAVEGRSHGRRAA